MNTCLGIWIDHKHAVIVNASPTGISVKTLASPVHSHPHFSGSQVGGGEKKYEERFAHQLARFYDEVIGHVGQPEAIFILGPGEAKSQLEDRLTRSKTLSGTEIDVEAADEMTEPQIVAKVREHFGLEPKRSPRARA